MRFNLFNRFFSKYKTKQNYEFEFRVSFPLADGSYRETSNIKIIIPAFNKEEARKKLAGYVSKKAKATVINVMESDPTIKHKVKTTNPLHN